MKRNFNNKFKKYIYDIFAGDYYVTDKKDVILTTLLGSCISVCLRDRVNGVVGMNHFMLPGAFRKGNINFNRDARYGLNAMKKMTGKMMKMGAKKSNLEAKIFGGGKILDSVLINVAQANIDFTLQYLKKENIPITSGDVGGRSGRKIFLLSGNFSVFLKRIHYKKSLVDMASREKQFLMQIEKNVENE